MKCGPIWHPYAEWWDANFDGILSVSDILPSIGRILAMPGILVTRVTVENLPDLAQFLELSCDTVGGGFVSISALAGWYLIGATVLYAVAVLHVVLGAAQDFASAALVAVKNPKKTIIFLYQHPPFLIKVLILPYFFGRHLIAEVKRAPTVPAKAMEAAVGIFLYTTLVLLWLVMVGLLISEMFEM